MLTDNFNTTDSANLNLNLLTRQSGIAATQTWATAQLNGAAFAINNNSLLITNTGDTSLTNSYGVVATINLKPYQPSDDFRVRVNISPVVASGDSWGRCRGGAIGDPSKWILNGDGLGVFVRPGGSWGVAVGGGVPFTGNVPAAATYLVEIEVNNSVATAKINGVTIASGSIGTYATNIVSLTSNAGEFGGGATGVAATFDDFEFTTPGLTLLNNAIPRRHRQFPVLLGSRARLWSGLQAKHNRSVDVCFRRHRHGWVTDRVWCLALADGLLPPEYDVAVIRIWFGSGLIRGGGGRVQAWPPLFTMKHRSAGSGSAIVLLDVCFQILNPIEFVMNSPLKAVDGWPLRRLGSVALGLMLLGRAIAQPLPAFDFTNPADSAGWAPTHDISSLTTTSTGLLVQISGGDPFTEGPPRDYPAGVPLWLRLKLLSDAAARPRCFTSAT